MLCHWLEGMHQTTLHKASFLEHRLRNMPKLVAVAISECLIRRHKIHGGGLNKLPTDVDDWPIKDFGSHQRVMPS